MFIGTYYHTLEAKSRLAIPAKFRRLLHQNSIITRGLDGCLFIFPADQWKKIVEKLNQSPISSSDARAFIRLMTHEAYEVHFDKQGRTLIPKHLTAYAGINKETVIAGTLNRVEIWDQKKYHLYTESIEKQSEVLAENLREFGI